MITGIVSEVFSRERITEAIEQHPLLCSAFACWNVLLVWRLWRFTVRPVMYPDDPQEFPYWIPGLGHAKSFFIDSQELMTRARVYFGNKREPYSITVAGQLLYILTNSNDVAAVFKNTEAFSFEGFIKDVMGQTGVSKEGVDRMFQEIDPKKATINNPLHKPLGRLARDLHLHQLSPGQRLPDASRAFVKYFEKADLNLIKKDCRRVEPIPDSKAVRVQLFDWTADMLTMSGQEAYWGKLLKKIEPDMVEIFMEFDLLTWQMLYQYPDFLCGKLRAAQNKMIEAFEKYYRSPRSERSDTVWWTHAFEDEIRALNYSDRDFGIIIATIYWGINTNTRKSVFWMLAHMLKDPQLIAIVRKETEPALQGETPDLGYLETSCPQLGAIWDEAMRLGSLGLSVRHVVSDVIIGNKILRKGSRVMIPYRQLHFDENVFGSGVAEFQSQRFLKNPALQKSPSFRPFGGGITMCPGRFVAKNTALAFIATIVNRFEIELDPPSQPFPIAEEGIPVVGLMDPKIGSDYKIRLTQR